MFVFVATFQKDMPLLQGWCLESQLGRLLPQDHLRGGALQGSLVFSVLVLPTAERMCDGGEKGVKGNSYRVTESDFLQFTLRAAAKRFCRETMTVNTCWNWSYEEMGNPALPQVARTMDRVLGWGLKCPNSRGPDHMQIAQRITKLVKRQNRVKDG